MPRYRRSSFGTIEKRGRDTWRIRWNEVRGGVATRPSETVHGTRAEAADRLAQIHAGLVGRPRGGGRRLHRPMTVREVYETWYEPEEAQALEEGRISARTRNQHMVDVRRVLAAFGERPITSITPVEVQDFVSPLTRQPAAGALSALRRLMDYAVTYDVMADNVARRRYVMPTVQSEKGKGAYTLAELASIARAARGRPSEAAMLLMMFGSCRTGEALGPTVGDVERYRSHGMTLAVVWIRRQVTGTRDLDERLKTPESARPVVIPPPWSRRVLAMARCRRGEAFLSDDGLGRPVSRWVFAREWGETVTAAGVRPLEPRAARRSWETFMSWDMGVEWRKVERMMGHRLPGVTGAHYDKPGVQQFADAVAEAFVRKGDLVRSALSPN